MIGTIQHDGIEITYDYIPAVAERGPSYASGGEPAIEARLEIIEAEVVDPKTWWQVTGGMDLPDDPLEWAREDWMVEDMCWEQARESR